MREFDKQAWLEELADKYGVPVQQVMIAWTVYVVTSNMCGFYSCKTEFQDVLDKVF